MADVTDIRCLWCGQPYERRKDGGKRQRFCSPAHRRAFHHAAARWMAAAIETGAMSRALLREGLASNAALVRSASAEELASEGHDGHRPPAPPEVPPWRRVPGWPMPR